MPENKGHSYSSTQKTVYEPPLYRIGLQGHNSSSAIADADKITPLP